MLRKHLLVLPDMGLLVPHDNQQKELPFLPASLHTIRQNPGMHFSFFQCNLHHEAVKRLRGSRSAGVLLYLLCPPGLLAYCYHQFSNIPSCYWKRTHFDAITIPLKNLASQSEQVKILLADATAVLSLPLSSEMSHSGSADQFHAEKLQAQ